MMLKDKVDITRGLQESLITKQITTYQNIIQIDTRDCVGVESLAQARLAFEKNGGRKEASGIITGTTGIGIFPVTIFTIIPLGILKNGDYVFITGVQGNTICNNGWIISNVTANSFDISTSGINTYSGGGQWVRPSDNGYPAITDTTCTITGNEMIINLQKKLKAIRSIALNIGIIPRDIIPIISYYKDLYSASVLDPSIYQTFIVQETSFMKEKSYGFYSTNLSIFRSYAGTFAMPNQVTPPPLKLWNPPLGVWPNQPLSYPYQTVPTYKSGDIIVNGVSCFLILSGYGVYDLKDWTLPTRIETEIARKKLLGVIIRQQSRNDINLQTMINSCTTTSTNLSPFGYGSFQRFVPGPGIQLNYQPGTSDGANPTVVGPDNPIAFPDFRGNVWGPYDTPGDRFQKMGLRDTVQDLFLNGDLDNLLGIPIIKPDITVSNIPTDPDLGLININSLSEVNFGTASTSTSPNILNAMRIVSNGFGAASIIATGSGTVSSSSLAASGGIGPSSLPAPSAWSLTGIYGAPSISDPNAVGPLSWNLLVNGTIPQSSEGNNPNTYPAQNSSINHRVGWYDLGPNQGAFKNNIKQYFLYSALSVPSTNLVIQVFQFPRNERSQSTNSMVGCSIFNVPIRLIPDVSSDGSFGYLEGLYGLITQSSDFEYWGQRFITPMASLDKISLNFFTYEGLPIPLEKQLSYPNNYYDNTSPLLRSKKSISLIFRIETYQYATPGLNDIIDRILGSNTQEDDLDYEFSGLNTSIRASNYYQ